MKGYQKYGHDASCLKTIITTKKKTAKQKKKHNKTKKEKQTYSRCHQFL